MQSKKIQLLESIASTIMAESVETEECLDVACEQISMVLSHIRGLPRQIHGENAFNCPSDSLILPEVEDSGGIVTLGKLKRDGPEVELIFLEKEGTTRVLAVGVLDMMHQIVQWWEANIWMALS